MLLTTLCALLSLSVPPDTLPKPVSVLPLPIVYYTPETRLAYGAAAAVTFRFRRDLAAIRADRIRPGATLPRPSQVTLGFAYTQNRQVLVYLPFQIFYDRDRYYLNGEAGYYRYTYFFFGTGERDVPREVFGVNFPRIRVNAFRRVAPTLTVGRLYAGLRYQYEDYRVTDVEPGGLLASGTVPGGRGSRLSGVGLGLFFDSRDVVFFPSRGVVADVTYLHQDEFLGGNVRFDRYAVDVAAYQRLHRRAILALNWFVSFTRGTAPFNAMTLLGGTRRMRGYYEGRFRDQNGAVVQGEVRFDLVGRLGGVLFGAAGILGDERRVLRPGDPKFAGGGGVRFTLNRRDHLNIRLDYGLGRQSSGLYLTIGEAF